MAGGEIHTSEAKNMAVYNMNTAEVDGIVHVGKKNIGPDSWDISQGVMFLPEAKNEANK